MLRTCLQFDCAAVFLSDLLRQRQTKANAALLTFTHKGQEHRLANRLGYARSVVRNLDANVVLILLEADRDEWIIVSAMSRLASVQQEVVDGASKFLRVDPDLHGRHFRIDNDPHVARCGM